MANERTTIRELARLSGVSIGTVSRALNGYTDVSPGTRERIVRLAEELDYTPSASARTLVTQRSHVVGVFLDTGEGHPDLQHPFFHEVLVGVQETAGAQGFDLLLFATEQPGNGYGRHNYVKRCRHHNVDGVILMGVDHNDEEVRRLTASTIPTIGVDVQLTGRATSYVCSDNLAGGALAVDHLAQQGHRRIAVVHGPTDTLAGNDRLKGYRQGLQRAGLAFRDEYVTQGDFYVDSGHEAAARLLELDEPPTAIVAASDLMAVGAIRAAAARGLAVPRDLSVVGFDDILLAAHLQPGLTTLRQDKAGLGTAAARALMAMNVDADPAADADANPAAPTILPVQLVTRGTTAPPPSAGR
ncbi:Catabolite control protein A [Baekduia alba]|uniref:LacI family DNA-binding transcriptional regulator n=1 Tax=Baekduia alba TaxID=2997333 RepID=UPI0023410FF9|nr:LacI family DNA-binding transcriptional regulator [Baekduia alba]WCB91881.1 Catabolite control protein A [Baekduia alba]